MGQALDPSGRRVEVRGLGLHVREWPGNGSGQPPFVLVHGLASNSLTWAGVARVLNQRGHYVAAVDQRGHGLSAKPDRGYSFDEVTADLRELLVRLGLQKPIIAGQSWGGNVVLDFAARYPEAARGIVLVDGGFIELSAAPGSTWEQVELDLKPPAIKGYRQEDVRGFMRSRHPGWSEEGIEGTLANLETLPDGTIRAWLSLERHMLILRALWEHKPSQVYSRVRLPALLAAAGGEGANPPSIDGKQQAVNGAAASLRNGQVKWFADTDHDIHVHRPQELAEWMLTAVDEGFFGV